MFEGFQTISHHGSSQGITTRFIFQMLDLGRFAFTDKRQFDNKFQPFFDVVINDFTHFYDLYHEIINLYNDYNQGLRDGRYIKFDERGVFTIDRENEIILSSKIKTFFINGRIVIQNWSNSKVIDDDYFELNKLLIVKEHNFKKNRELLLSKDSSNRYEILFDMR